MPDAMERPATLVDVLRRAAGRDDAGYSYATDDIADVRFESFQQLNRRADRIAGALRARGLVPGDRVGLILHDAQQFIGCFFGAMVAGLVPVPIAPPPVRFGQDGNFLRHITPVLRKARPRLLLTDGDLAALLNEQRQGAAPICDWVVVEELLDATQPRAQGAAAAGADVRMAPEDTAFLQFTSGSTSQPRGVRVTHANLVANLHAISEHGLRATPDDYCVSWLPLNHDMGLIGKVLVPLFAGMRGVLLMPTALFLKRPLAWLQAISRHRATITFAPSFAYNLCVARSAARPMADLDLSTLRIAGCGAEPVRCEVLSAFADRFAPHGFRAQAFLPCYGLAEHTLAATFAPVGGGLRADRVAVSALVEGRAEPMPQAGPALPSTVQIANCGRAFPGHEVKIVDDGGAALGERQVGHVLLRGPSVAQGYFEDEAATASAWSGGWLRTGDLGYLAGGDLHVCGRAKDLIIVHGRNYHPHDIEWEAAQTQTGRQGNVVAFGVEDAVAGRERVIIAAETKVAGVGREELQHSIRSRLLEALALVVDQVLLLPPHSLPKTSSGKLQRRLARDLFLAGKLGEPQPAQK